VKILTVVGTRPNFMKAAPIVRALAPHRDRLAHILVHTGQHYDPQMSGCFFRELGLPEPDFNLAVGSGSQAQQTAQIMLAIEPVLRDERPDLLVVVGDVNSTLASALTAKKMDIAIAHVEAGLRSFDRAMPEETNRLCVDAISDLLFTTDRLADANLRREGVCEDKIHFVGNVMIDSLLVQLDRIDQDVDAGIGEFAGPYATLTLHRPANVDCADKLAEILDAVRDALHDFLIVFPVHPRTRQRVGEFGLSDWFVRDPHRPGLLLTGPRSYSDFLRLVRKARLVLTDSGGVQEETTVLGVPCVTLRDNTERPITISEGTNRLAGTSRAGILAAIADALRAPSEARRPEKWDGHAAERIVEILLTKVSQ
jgi:UDP-N-acetylglucosamine 2-epimerase (non-hydrolysing)